MAHLPCQESSCLSISALAPSSFDQRSIEVLYDSLMGWRWRRSVGMGPFRYTLSKRGLGYSVGLPGCRVSTTPDGRRYLVLSVPGTGFSWWKRLEDRSTRTNAGSTNPTHTAASGTARARGRGLPPGVGRGGKVQSAAPASPTRDSATNEPRQRPVIDLTQR